MHKQVSLQYTSSAKNSLSMLTLNTFVALHENVKDQGIASAETSALKQTTSSMSCSAWILPLQFVVLYCPTAVAVGKQLLKLHGTEATSNNYKHIIIKFTCPI